MIRSLLLLVTALFSATACGPLSARPLVQVAVIDRDDGDWLPQYRGRGDTWVPGIPGHRYAVRLTNTSAERVLVVLSVDGVNAVSGEDADPSQAGYVLAPWQSTEIAGWRKSLEDVAQFYFTDLPDSYAARTGRPDNVGVIGIAVFRERRPVAAPAPMPFYRDSERREANAAAEAAPADSARAYGQAKQSIGTGHGAREWSPVGRTEFVRAGSRPAQLTQLRYDAPDRLAALGILPRPDRRWAREDAPQAFPGGFVADPPNW
ncbi:hypothetical protein [Luteimonas aquatica]|uniref:hypothetical protein n=1 Tax=Luteimonas aquatica TaxID=450364 RepID=UPI001F56674C|nr:hypothetical protein [Luteimonas aquatica]